MKSRVFDKIFNKASAQRHIEYLVIDEKFNIHDTSEGVQRFADSPQEFMLGKDVRDSFPELIGVEDILIDILSGHRQSFEYKGIARFSEHSSPLYIDLYVISDEAEEDLGNKLFLFLEDVTEKMVLEQNLVQRTNELELLLSKLDAAKKYIDKIITSMADALFVTNCSGNIKTINQAAIDLFEYSEAELINQPISLIFHDKTLMFQVIQQYPLLPGELLKDLEVDCHTKTGKNISVAFSCSAIQTEIEGLQDFIYIGRDITERQRIETERQRVEKRLLAQYVITRVLSESLSLEKALPKIILGICESLGWDVGEFWIPEAKKNDREVRLRCVEFWSKPSLEISEFKEVSKQTFFAPGFGLPGSVWTAGNPLWINDLVDRGNFGRSQLAVNAGLQTAFGFPIQSDSEILGVMTFFSREKQEIEEDFLQIMLAIGSQIGQFIKRKKAELALAESEERYRDLFENASDLIQSVEANGRFVYVNRAWEETMGYSQDNLAEMTVFDIIHPDCKIHYLETFYRVMSGEKIDHFEVKFLTKDGRTIFVEGSINCKIVDGQPVSTRAIFRDITSRVQVEKALRQEQEQTERLLLNILPQPIAQRLKHEQTTIAESFADVSVMFADIVGFTELSSRTSPTELVEILNVIFSEFDQLAELHDLEKIKTIGDAYMVVGGLPKPQSNHAIAIAEMALDMQVVIAQFNQETGNSLNMRIGINTGSVVAGVIGTKKFIYDLWGDTVNIASRMESHSLPGKIQVTEATYQHLRDRYLFDRRGRISVKGKGEMATYFLIGRI